MSNENKFSRSGVTKVFIMSLDDSKKVTAHFNPKELQVDKTINWSKTNEANKSNGQGDTSQGIHLEFTGAEGRSMSLELLFDEEDYDKVDGAVGVVDSIATLEKLASVRKPGSKEEKEKRPHHCKVVWGGAGGTLEAFHCVIESLSTKYTMFSPGGVPLRATCTVKLKEADVLATAKAEGKANAKGAPAGGAKK
jgi:Contractile injection system tube protein